MKNYRVEISIKTIGTLLLVGLSLYVVSRVLDIIILLMLAFVLMTALHPIVQRIERFKTGRIPAVLLVYGILIGTLVLAFAVIIPPLIDQTINLLQRFNLKNVPILSELANHQFNYEEVGNLLSTYGGSVTKIFSYVTSTFGVVFSFFTVLVMSLYLLLERNHLYQYSSFLFRTKDKEERGKKLFDEVEISLGTWVRGEFILMVTIGTMTFIGLTLLKVPYALPLAIVAGLLEALPNLGPTIAAVPAIFVAALTVSPLMGGAAALLYWLIQSIENNFIVPYVMKKTVGINPLTSIVLILMGFRFGGVIGALLVIPYFIVMRVILKEFSHEISSVFIGKSE